MTIGVDTIVYDTNRDNLSPLFYNLIILYISKLLQQNTRATALW